MDEDAMQRLDVAKPDQPGMWGVIQSAAAYKPHSTLPDSRANSSWGRAANETYGFVGQDGAPPGTSDSQRSYMMDRTLTERDRIRQEKHGPPIQVGPYNLTGAGKKTDVFAKGFSGTIHDKEDNAVMMPTGQAFSQPNLKESKKDPRAVVRLSACSPLRSQECCACQSQAQHTPLPPSPD